ncbi:hypothetical protein [Bacillus salipaludis]|uniref:hypothetical protein n=1 Tax=Bacillus salipaludis TaxID=2547811 RepID=UPI002E1C8BE3|nr:hypothetical protein [Bacillus salipaludis]
MRKYIDIWRKLEIGWYLKYVFFTYSIFFFSTSFIDVWTPSEDFNVLEGKELRWIQGEIFTFPITIPKIDIYGTLSHCYHLYSDRWSIAEIDISRLKESIFLFCIALIMPKIYFKNHPNIVSFIRFFYFLDSFYLFNLIIENEKDLNNQLQIINATYFWIVAIVIVIIDFLRRLLRNGFFTAMRKYIINYAKYIKLIVLILPIIVLLISIHTSGYALTYYTFSDGTRWIYAWHYIILLIVSIFLFCIALIMPKVYFKNHPNVVSFIRIIYFLVSINHFHIVIEYEYSDNISKFNPNANEQILNVLEQIKNAKYLWIVAKVIVIIDFLIRLLMNGFFPTFFATTRKYAKQIRFILMILSIFIFLYFFDIPYWMPYWIPNPLIESIELIVLVTVAAYIMPKYYLKNHANFMSFIRFFYFIESLFIIVSLLLNLIGDALLNITNKHTFITLLVAFLIVGFAIIFIDFLIRLSQNLKDPRTINGLFSRIKATVGIIITLLTALLVPNCVFGFCYWLGLERLEFEANPDIFKSPLGFLDAYYLSFVINYALPLNNPDIGETIKTINSDTLLRIIEIIHITVFRIIDLTIIAVVIKYVHFLIEGKNGKNEKEEKRFKLIKSVRKRNF